MHHAVLTLLSFSAGLALSVVCVLFSSHEASTSSFNLTDTIVEARPEQTLSHTNQHDNPVKGSDRSADNSPGTMPVGSQKKPPNEAQVESVSIQSATETFHPKPARSSAAAEDSSVSLAAPSESSQIGRLRRESPEARTLTLLEAIRSPGDIKSEILAPDVLRQLPDYRSSILPMLKDEGLTELLSRFTEVDWISWEFSGFAMEGGPTLAKSFVDQVSARNSELGSYLALAAQSWSRLFNVTRSGRVFKLEDYPPQGRESDRQFKALQRPSLRSMIGDSAEPVVSNLNEAIDRNLPRLPGSPVRGEFAELLSQDPLFTATLERLRARFVSSYLQSHPDDPMRSLSLLCSLRLGEIGDFQIKQLTRLFRRFTLDGTARYRVQVRELLNESAGLVLHEVSDLSLKRAIAEFYLMSSIDALDSEDKATSLLLLDESISYFRGLRGQELLASAISKRYVEGRNETNVKNTKEPSQSNVRLPEQADETAVKDESSAYGGFNLLKRLPLSTDKSKLSTLIAQGMSYLIVVLLLLVVGGGAFVFFLYNRSVRALSTLPNRKSRSRANSTSLTMTAPNDVNFGEEDFDQTDIRRSAAA